MQEVKVIVFLLSSCQVVDHSDWTTLSMATAFLGQPFPLALATVITKPLSVLVLLSPCAPSGFLVVMTPGCRQPISCWFALGLLTLIA